MNEEQRAAALEQLRGAYLAVCAEDFDAFMPKMLEYGAWSLQVTGQAVLPEGGVLTDEERFEAGCALYLLGKATRAVGAVKQGQSVSQDTLKDVVTYGMMARMSWQILESLAGLEAVPEPEPWPVPVPRAIPVNLDSEEGQRLGGAL